MPKRTAHGILERDVLTRMRTRIANFDPALTVNRAPTPSCTPHSHAHIHALSLVATPFAEVQYARTSAFGKNVRTLTPT